MKNLHKFLSIAAAAIAMVPAGIFAQTTSPYAGNQSTGFGGPLGKSSLTITDNPATGVITFSLAATASINNIAFYFSTGSGGVGDLSGVTDTGDPGRRSISGQGTSAGQTNVVFATGFSAKYAVAIDNSKNANLFQIVPGQGYLTYLSGANDTQSGTTYGFSVTEAQLGIAPGGSFNFVATLSNANDGNNSSQVYRSNETIGASMSDNNATGNLANTGTLTYTGFDTYTTTVPEPATCLAGTLLVTTAGWTASRTRRLAA